MPDPAPTPMTPDQKVLSTVISQANSLAEAVTTLKTISPSLAKQLEGSSLAASRSPWGVLASSLAGWLIAHYGLACSAAAASTASCLAPDTVQIIQTGAVLAGAFVGAYIMRLFTNSPITGILSKTPVAEAPAAPVAVVGTPIDATTTKGATQ